MKITYRAYRKGIMCTSGTLQGRCSNDWLESLKFDYGADYVVIVYSDDTVEEFDLNNPDIMCEPWQEPDNERRNLQINGRDGRRR